MPLDVLVIWQDLNRKYFRKLAIQIWKFISKALVFLCLQIICVGMLHQHLYFQVLTEQKMAYRHSHENPDISKFQVCDWSVNTNKVLCLGGFRDACFSVKRKSLLWWKNAIDHSMFKYIKNTIG